MDIAQAAPDEAAKRSPKTLPVRPRDAGTVIILDESAKVPRILLGRRSAKLVFMAGKMVFPGGRLELSDVGLAGGFSLPADAEARLMAATTRRFDPRRATGVALAAIRETFEEVGAMIGRAAPFRTSAGGWEAFAAAGVLPDPALLIPVARAITPPGAPRRYDTRFFCVSAADIVSQVAFEARPDPEFDAVGWYSLDEIGTLDLPGITRQVLCDIDARLRDGRWRDAALPMPFYRKRHGRSVRDMI